jgi:hypothetical protein
MLNAHYKFRYYKSMMLSRLGFLMAVALITACSSAPIKREKSQLLYTPAQLRLMEVDEMSTLVGDRVREYKKTHNEKFAEEALIIALSRPDSDNILDRELQTIENSFELGQDWEKAVTRVVDRAGDAIKSKTCSVQDEASYTIVLENVLSQFRAQFNKLEENTDFELATIKKIADMDLEVSEAAAREAKLNAMSTLVSPSEIARKLLIEIKALPKSRK